MATITPRPAPALSNAQVPVQILAPDMTTEEWLATVGVDGVQQAISELRGFAAALSRDEAQLTGSQIFCLAAFAEAELGRRLAEGG